MILVFLLSSISTAYGGNILILNPTHGHSHVRFLGNLADLWADDGHNVTVLSPIWDDSVTPHGTSNPKVYKLEHRSSYLTFFLSKLDMKKPSFWDMPEPDGRTFKLEEQKVFQEAFEMQYKGILEDKELMQKLQNSKFDLGVAEYFELGALGVFELLDIKTVISAASLGIHGIHYEIAGLPFFTSFIPGYITTYSSEMTFWERLSNWKIEYDAERFMDHWVERLEQIFRTYNPEMLGLRQLAVERTGVIFSNVNEFTESPRPKTNLIQYIGGTHIHPPKPLEPALESLLNLRPSTVLFSFGTYLKACQMPLKLKLEILEAFVSFPQVTFLWKYEECPGDEMSFSEYSNVVPKPWWPQSDILGDERVKAFITHGGMNSMLETIYRGKPVIAVPLFGDQYVNVRTSVNFGLSVMIKRTELSKKSLVGALRKVLQGRSPIAEKARMAGKILEGRGEDYKKELLRWTRLLLDFGPMEHHRLPTKHLNLLQLCHLDIFIFACFLPVALLFCLFAVYRIFVRRSPSKEKAH